MKNSPYLDKPVLSERELDDAVQEINKRANARKLISELEDFAKCEELTEIVRKMLIALKSIAELPDPKSSDRGSIRQARHIAKCIIAEYNEGLL